HGRATAPRHAPGELVGGVARRRDDHCLAVGGDAVEECLGGGKADRGATGFDDFDGATARHASKDRPRITRISRMGPDAIREIRVIRGLSLSRYDPETTTGREECSSRPVVRIAF